MSNQIIKRSKEKNERGSEIKGEREKEKKESECVFVSVCERASVCVSERERDSEWVCLWDRKSNSEWVCLWERERVYMCVLERERDFERHFFSTENIIEKFSAPCLQAEILLDI